MKFKDVEPKSLGLAMLEGYFPELDRVSNKSYDSGTYLLLILLQKGYIPSLTLYKRLKTIGYNAEYEFIQKLLIATSQHPVVISEPTNKLNWEDLLVPTTTRAVSYNLHEIRLINEDLRKIYLNFYLTDKIDFTGCTTSLSEAIQLSPVTLLQEFEDVEDILEILLYFRTEDELVTSLLNEKKLTLTTPLKTNFKYCSEEDIVATIALLITNGVDVYSHTTLYYNDLVPAICTWLKPNKKSVVKLPRKGRLALFKTISALVDDLQEQFPIESYTPEITQDLNIFKTLMCRYHALDYADSYGYVNVTLQQLNNISAPF